MTLRTFLPQVGKIRTRNVDLHCRVRWTDAMIWCAALVEEKTGERRSRGRAIASPD
ncbi:hypothetical protein [Leptolyngbya sp. KIOST-1]|uniref:hypothetical protein n=1 Tax=Leptolyngbya sp. KIOST-1 TaxID=1229172 RepID=UPI000A4043FE|nr:hypothetical protein [Leptolyngbya sp. KIOST-1]